MNLTEHQTQMLDKLHTASRKRRLGVIDRMEKDVLPHALIILWKRRLASYVGDGLWRVSLGGIAWKRGIQHELPDRTFREHLIDFVTEEGPIESGAIANAMPYNRSVVKETLKDAADDKILVRTKYNTGYMYEAAP